MKQTIAKLNSLGAKLPDNATDEQINAAIVDYVKPSTSGLSQAVVDVLIAVGKKAGAVSEQNETAMRQLAVEKPDLFAGLIDLEKLNVTPTKDGDDNLRISDLVKELKGQGGETAKKWNDLTDTERDTLYDKNPDAFKAMYKEHFKVDYDKA